MLRAFAQLALVVAVSVPAWAARVPGPAFRIPLQPLGFETPKTPYLTAGGTMFTVAFIDPTHLLATWNTHGLIPRLPDAQPDDQDRLVEAVMLDLPSGNVLARTTWRMRDHAQYLWPLGRGHFLLRLRNELFTISPLEDLPTGHAFERHLLLETRRPMGFVFVSPDFEVLTVETLPPKPKPAEQPTSQAKSSTQSTVLKPRPAPASGAGDPVLQTRPDTTVQVNFYRVLHHEPHDASPGTEAGAGGPGVANGGILLQAAGVVRAPNAVFFPLTGEGYLDVVKETESTYLFDFAPFGGKRVELPAFETSCYPHAHFVDRFNFVAFGCRGSEERQELGFFNLRGEHPWVSTFTNEHINPAIVSVPAAGRFALVRTLIHGSAVDLANLVDAEIGDQELTVFQAHDGRQLLKVLPTPVQRAGQNFDLSPDGMELAVVRGGNIEVYKLPPVSKRDQQEIAAATVQAGPAGSGPIRIGRQVAKDDTPPAATGATGAPGSAGETGSVPEAGAAQSVAASKGKSAAGDADPDASKRKPPTLYDAEHPKPN